jgi:hypothetical protein
MIPRKQTLAPEGPQAPPTAAAASAIIRAASAAGPSRGLPGRPQIRAIDDAH